MVTALTSSLPRTAAARGIISAIGNTPIVALDRLFRGNGPVVFAKLEGLNPGGSMKDRPALAILQNCLDSGSIGPDTVIVESSSGNMGVGLAQACSYFGLRFICVVDPKTTDQNLALLRAYGAQVELVTQPDPGTGEFLQARLNRVKYLLSTIENAFWTDQYSNSHNAMAHQQTMREILADLGHKVDYVFCAVSTCGTMRGCSEYIKANRLSTKVIAVDALGSVIFGGERMKRLIPGHGAAVRPALYRDGLASECIWVSDLDCVVGCRRLALHEAILAGGSSGAIVMAIESVRHTIGRDAVCVAILPDRGERYLTTIYSDEWVRKNFGEVFHLWSRD